MISLSTWLKGTIIDELLLAVIAIMAVVAALFAAGHALLKKRDPRSALVWVVVTLTIPVLGPLAYWVLGINRITRRALRWQQTGRRHWGDDLFLGERLPSEPLADDFRHMQDLARLGDRVVRNRLCKGNRIQPLVDGEGAYPPMIAAISKASHSIHMSSYIFDGDGVGAEFVAALAAAASRGVTVRVIVDALGERYSSLKARKALAGSGVDVRQYLPLSRGAFINLRNHRKLLVVDGNMAFSGGMNIRNRHCVERSAPGEATNDLHFSIQGPIVSDLQNIFMEDWYFVTGQILEDSQLLPENLCVGDAVARVIGDGPDREFRKLEWIVIGALSVARSRARIMTPYFIPDRPMITALVTAALRGVEVTLVLPSNGNLPFVDWASRASYWELLKNGVRILEQGPSFVHTKLMVVDGLWSLIGSANLDTRSLRLNFELNISVFDKEFARQMDLHFDQAILSSRLITLTEVDSRSLPIRLRDGAARLFSPYL